MTFRLSILLLILGSTFLDAVPHVPNRQESLERKTQEYFVSYYCCLYSVPEDWVQAIIRVESNWNAYAVSAKGAVGLMQSMPVTARRFKVRNRFNSAANVEAGIKYLAVLLRRFNGDQISATAAYFAGEGRITSRKEKDFSREVLAYVVKVNIPYSEYLRNSRSD
jgi:soluble lytic murein transglycosylase-like protein